MTGSALTRWTVIVPIKHTARGKSRLGADAPLARAIALDTVAAISASAAVEAIVVVTSDPELQRSLPEACALVRIVAEPDNGAAPHSATIDETLNAAVSAALATLTGGPVAVVHADLPALKSDDLTATLRAAEEYPFAAVADADERGTVMLTAQAAGLIHPLFGPDSYARHLAAGAAPLTAPASIRRDIDTADHLAAVVSSTTLALGPRTRALSAR